MKSNSDRDLSQEAKERRQASKQFLDKSGISFNADLKLLTEDKLKKRSHSTVQKSNRVPYVNSACMFTLRRRQRP